MSLLNQALTACFALAHQPSAEKSPIKSELQDILSCLPAANDNELAWSLIPFPEDWWVT